MIQRPESTNFPDGSVIQKAISIKLLQVCCQIGVEALPPSFAYKLCLSWFWKTGTFSAQSLSSLCPHHQGYARNVNVEMVTQDRRLRSCRHVEIEYWAKDDGSPIDRPANRSGLTLVASEDPWLVDNGHALIKHSREVPYLITVAVDMVLEMEDLGSSMKEYLVYYLEPCLQLKLRQLQLAYVVVDVSRLKNEKTAWIGTISEIKGGFVAVTTADANSVYFEVKHRKH